MCCIVSMAKDRWWSAVSILSVLLMIPKPTDIDRKETC